MAQIEGKRIFAEDWYAVPLEKPKLQKVSDALQL